MAPGALRSPPPARRHFVSSSRHSPNPPRPGPGPGTDLARLPLGPQPPPSASAPLTPPFPLPRAALGARNAPARVLRPALVPEPWRGLAAASSGPALRPGAGRGRPEPGRAAGPSPGAAYRAGGGRRCSPRRGLSQRDWAESGGGGCGGAGGREGREGPSSELSGSGQAPRAGPAVSTSRHCPRETQEKAEGSAPPPLPAASGQPPAGACAVGRAGGRCRPRRAGAGIGNMLSKHQCAK
ncbi:uncharacterized protein PRD47_004312 isoform 1-T1 [Ara ararauna]